MARSAGTTIENNFSKGLITEASGLNFPENAATEAWNCVFRETGQVSRRLGIDFEAGYDTGTDIDDVELSGATVEFVWKAVSTVGVLTFVVIQTGDKITFYVQSATDSGASGLSAGQKGFIITLSDYSALPATYIRNTPCGFASGDGYLFITHPRILPLVVSYNLTTDAITVTQVNIGIRDFEGVQDNLGIGEQPDTLTNLHWYNLKNQGWWKDVLCVDQGGGVASVLPNSIPDETQEYYFPFLIQPSEPDQYLIQINMSGQEPPEGSYGYTTTAAFIGSDTGVGESTGNSFLIPHSAYGTTFTYSATSTHTGNLAKAQVLLYKVIGDVNLGNWIELDRDDTGDLVDTASVSGSITISSSGVPSFV